MLARIDAIAADIADLDAKIEELIAPFAQAVDRLDLIPGVAPTAAAVIIAEIGLDMTRFPTPGHLTSWARFAPGVKESAGKHKGASSTGHGNPYLARALGEAAIGASRTNTFLGERYRRLARRRGKKKAVVAVGRSILTIVWHLLSNPGTEFNDLGADFYDDRVGTERRRREHIRQLEALGYKLTLEPPPDPQINTRHQTCGHSRCLLTWILGLDASRAILKLIPIPRISRDMGT
jgi:hypothetical protein